jgi:hypothetical protein
MFSAALETKYDPLSIQHRFEPAFVGIDTRGKIPVCHGASQHQHSHGWPPDHHRYRTTEANTAGSKSSPGSFRQRETLPDTERVVLCPRMESILLDTVFDLPSLKGVQEVVISK